MKVYCADLESSGLLHHLIEQGDKAKLHNVCLMDISNLQRRLYHWCDKEELQSVFDEGCILIMHNGVCYDKHALIHFGFDVSKVVFLDTLPLSWYLDLNRPKHGLEDYGVEFGVPKPVILDWENQTQEDYDHRVKEDVRIQYLTYKKLKGRFEELYGELDDLGFSKHHCIRYLMFKMEQLAEQQNTKFKVDVKFANESLDFLTKEVETKTEELKTVMPRVPVKSKVKRPAKPFKKDGSLSAQGEKWKLICEASGVGFDYEYEIELIRGYDEPNPQSTTQLKDWLFSLGWIPQTFGFIKEDDGTTRQVPQIYVKGSGGRLCLSVEKLAEESPSVAVLVGLGVAKHRRGAVKSILDSLIFGEYVEAGAQGFTNTLRLKHRKPCVNLPKVSSKYGEYIRANFISREGYSLLGADLSALENLLKFNFQIHEDPDYVNSQMSDDFDPHLDLAVQAELLTTAEMNFFKIKKGGFPKERYYICDELQSYLELDDEGASKKLNEISKVRNAGKTGVYSCQYGAGAEAVARGADIPLAVAQKVVKAYRNRNWSIKVIGDDQAKKDVSFGRYQYNPISKMWYHLKYDKDSFSTLIQGSGSYILDLWLRYQFTSRGQYNFKNKPMLLATFHDEQVVEFRDEDEDEVKKWVLDSLSKLNNYLKLQFPFSCDVQTGKRYSDIH